MILTAASFNILREALFNGRLNVKQVEAMNYIVYKCSIAGLTYPETAYALGTIYHETGIQRRSSSGAKYIDRTMAPVKEQGSAAYLEGKKYYPYIGYGLVQLTWKDNYYRVGKLIGVDLIKNPEKALRWLHAMDILTGGMLNGWFTGVGFRRYRPVRRYDRNRYVRARAIINGTDKAELIADYAMTFEKALRS